MGNHVRRLNESINKTVWYEDEKFLAKLEKKNLHNLEMIGQIRTWKDILKKMYGENYHIEIQFDFKHKITTKESDFIYGKCEDAPNKQYTGELRIIKFTPIIHYPELTITNSATRNNSLVIKNLFVKVGTTTFKSGSNHYTCTIPTGILGGRTTVSPEEYIKGYQHSHLSSCSFRDKNDIYFGSFCLGSGEINNLHTMHKANKCIDENELELYFHMIDSYVIWESREGVPHIRMSKLRGLAKKDYNDLANYHCDGFYTVLKAYYKRNNKAANLDFKWVKGKYVLVDNAKFDSYLKYRGDDHHQYPDNHLALPCSDGSYFALNRNADLTNIPQWSYQFRDKEFEFKIDLETEIKVMDFVIHPKIKDYVRQQIERKINNYYLKRTTRTYVTSGENETKGEGNS